jgi:hypothetical protein
MQVHVGHHHTVKRAETVAERRRLGREGAVLSRWAHPGLVCLVRVVGGGEGEAEALVSVTASGGSLAALRGQPADRVAGWVVAAATVLDDLHHAGLAHGSPTLDHILLDERGGPVLCGLGSAVELDGSEGDRAAVAADVVALAAGAIRILGAGREEERLARCLEGWSRGNPRWGRSRRPSGSRLAAAVLSAVPTANVGPPVLGRDPGAPQPAGDAGAAGIPPAAGLEASLASVSEIPLPSPASDGTETRGSSGRPAEPDGAGLQPAARPEAPARAGPAARPEAPARAGSTPRAEPRSGRRARLVALAASLMAAGVGVAAISAGGHESRSGPLRWTVATVASGGRSFDLRVPDDQGAVSLAGHWGCGPLRLAVLYPAIGEVWAFPAWPGAGQSERARLVGRVPGAEAIVAVLRRPGCDQLVVRRLGGPPESLEVASGA